MFEPLFGAHFRPPTPTPYDKLLWAVRDNDLSSARELIVEQGVSPEPTSDDWDDSTPLYIAAQAGNADMIELLILLGAKVNFGAPGHLNATALSIAVGFQHIQAIVALLRHGANPYQKDLAQRDAFTANKEPIRNTGQSELISELLEQAAIQQKTELSGTTAVMLKLSPLYRASLKLPDAAPSSQMHRSMSCPP
ncbi:MAG: ankyrin repeat domain-containing protein [Gammaproteobacteria bacterium]|nr:ankyrin repeat domain-containing protein [Gammaproteobacteria bacterium]